MSNDTTKMLLGIDDEHLIIENGKIGDDGVIRLNGSLNYSPKACHNCGVINDHQIIGYGWRKTTIRFAKTLGSTVILCLNRRNFHCKACHTNFLAPDECSAETLHDFNTDPQINAWKTDRTGFHQIHCRWIIHFGFIRWSAALARWSRTLKPTGTIYPKFSSWTKLKALRAPPTRWALVWTRNHRIDRPGTLGPSISFKVFPGITTGCARKCEIVSPIWTLLPNW